MCRRHEADVSDYDSAPDDIPTSTVSPTATPADFYVVAIGASAGGLESLESLFSALPHDTGMAFVVLQHLSPDFKSLMDELLSRDCTSSVIIGRGPQGQAVECVCVNGTVSTCFEPGP